MQIIGLSIFYFQYSRSPSLQLTNLYLGLAELEVYALQSQIKLFT